MAKRVNIDGKAAEQGAWTERDLTAKHRRLETRLVEILAERGRRLSPTRRRLARIFLLTERHSRLDGLLEALREDFPSASMNDVKTTMRLLVEIGVARTFLAGDEPVFEHEHLAEHHDHMVCVKCDAIEEFLDDALEARQNRAMKQAEFRPLFHRLTIHGLCARCYDAASSYKPLSESRPGERVRVESIDDGPSLIHRLAGLGLTRGTEAEVIENDGKVILVVRGGRLALDRGMASKIHVASETAGGKESRK